MSTEDPLHNKYSLVKGAARRARQLQNGAQPLMPTKSMKACRVAQDEINQGKVTFVVNHTPKDTAALEEHHSNDGIDAD
jgi:DNA-directed RNA polymerase subunit omega